MQSPEECRDLADVRRAIDQIDHCIIENLGLRMRYVKAASQFKPDASSIPAPNRVAAMLPQRSRWAEEQGLDGKFIQSLYAQIIQWFILEQVEYWNHKQELK